MTPPGLAIELDEDRLGAGRDGGLEARRVVGVGPAHVPAEVLVGMVELVDRAAVELVRGDELVARLHQRVHGQELGRVAGGDGERRGAALERRDALLEHGAGRVADARVDVAERLQAEQRRGMVDVVEDEGGGLVDRRRPRAGRGVRRRAGMDREGVEAGHAVGHQCTLQRPRWPVRRLTTARPPAVNAARVGRMGEPVRRKRGKRGSRARKSSGLRCRRFAPKLVFRTGQIYMPERWLDPYRAR